MELKDNKKEILHRLSIENENLKIENEQLKNDFMNANMNCEHMTLKYEMLLSIMKKTINNITKKCSNCKNKNNCCQPDISNCLLENGWVWENEEEYNRIIEN